MIDEKFNTKELADYINNNEGRCIVKAELIIQAKGEETNFCYKGDLLIRWAGVTHEGKERYHIGSPEYVTGGDLEMTIVTEGLLQPASDEKKVPPECIRAELSGVKIQGKKAEISIYPLKS